MKTFLLTLSYQQRRLSCPHIQMLVEQFSLHTQYCRPETTTWGEIQNVILSSHKKKKIL